MTKYIANEEELKKAGELVELFCLFPKKYEKQTLILRLKINNKWDGWRLRDEVVEYLEFELGNTISTRVTPQFTNGLSNDVDELPLFASGDGADWLIDNKVSKGDIIDCEVCLFYGEIPFAEKKDKIPILCLKFVKGLAVIETDTANNEDIENNDMLDAILQGLTKGK